MNPLHEIISNDIRKTGWIGFDRFMELALYCPEYGFYEKETDKVGRGGDFYTSVSVGSLFGELLAFQFAEWLEPLAKAGIAPKLVEAGAYRAQLAGDILEWLKTWRPDLFDILEYWIAEPSGRLRARQESNLKGFAGKVKWFSDLTEMPEGIGGAIFSNELLDAIPVKRLGWDAAHRRWFEWGVAIESGNFVWQRGDRFPDVEIAPQLSLELQAVLPDEYTVEVHPAACAWWRTAAKKLGAGRLLALDYGFTNDGWIIPERTKGTLRTYSRHRVGNDPLAEPGELDITAHVNFSAIQAAGAASGLNTESFSTQESFLVRIAERTWSESDRFAEWNAARRKQFQTLVHPQHLGRSFRVLVQAR